MQVALAQRQIERRGALLITRGEVLDRVRASIPEHAACIEVTVRSCGVVDRRTRVLRTVGVGGGVGVDSVGEGVMKR